MMFYFYLFSNLTGRTAPTMVTKEMVAKMKAGSVTVDLAAEAGGNIETTVKDEKFVTPNGGKPVLLRD